MKAAQLTEYGGQNALQINEVDKPQVNAGEVLIEVRAAGVNPFDWKVREGYMKEIIPLEFPVTLGGDVSGVVSEVGEGVEGFEIGQEVFGSANAVGGNGSYAEFTPVSAEQLATKPTTLKFAEAGGVPLVFTSAYQALVEHMNLQSGQKILIHGAAGGIGSAAVQLAKHLGAEVFATASSDDTNFVRQLGADTVIDYQNEDFVEVGRELDAVFDTIGSETNAKSYDVLKEGGVLVSMVEAPDEEKAAKYAIRYVQQASRATTERLNKVAELIDSGAVKVHVDKAFELDQAAEALEYLKTGHPKGKVVIEVTPAQ